MTALEPPDSLHLQAAEGWLGLGDYAAANDELEQIAAANRHCALPVETLKDEAGNPSGLRLQPHFPASAGAQEEARTESPALQQYTAE